MRVLIYSVSAGAGCFRAAEAVHEGLRRCHPDAHVAHHDALKLAQPAFRRAYNGNYIRMINAMPGVWGWLYNKDEKFPQVSALSSARKFFQRFDHKNLFMHAAAQKPD